MPEPPATRSKGAAERDVPDEVATNRPTKLEAIAFSQQVGEIWRDFAIVQSVDRQRDSGVLRCRRDGIASLCLIAILRRQPHVHVLARAVARPSRDVQDQRSRSWSLHPDVDDGSEPPREIGRASCRERV